LAFSVKFRELPFRLALSSADVFVVIAATTAVKVTLVRPKATGTPLGTVMLVLLLDSATVYESEGTGADSVTVQVEVAGAVTVPGEQLRLLGTTAPGGGALTGSEIDPELPESGIEAPAAVEVTTPVI
jgi:hypothetical protein